MPDNSKDDKSKDDQTAGQNEQDEEDQKDTDEQESGVKFTPAQQAEINRLLAAERRASQKAAAKAREELQTLKTKDLPAAEKTKADLEAATTELQRYKARELAETIADDLKIPKGEQPKYLKYITASDEAGIKDQLKQLRKDFGAQQMGTGSNPAKDGKVPPNESINSYIRRAAGRG